jgi:hypothetical protein
VRLSAAGYHQVKAMGTSKGLIMQHEFENGVQAIRATGNGQVKRALLRYKMS